MTTTAEELQTVHISTKKDVQEVLDTVARRLLESHTSHLHSTLMLNTVLRLPNASELLDEKLKAQAKDLWTKLKSTGLQLVDPPLLFGLPQKADGKQ